MKISWLKLDNDNKSFKIPTSFGMDVFSVNSTENVDNKIDELIERLCPNGVRFEELKNKKLFKFYYGKGNRIPEDIGGIYDVYGANGIVSHINEYNCEDVTIIGHIGAVGMVNRCKKKCFVTYNGTIAEVVDKTMVNSQYLYYVLTTLNLPSYKKGSQPFLSVSDFDKIRIPVPPLEVQCEIVHILDDFTLLSALLSAELKVRQMQYEYYRNRLIKETNKVECKNLTLEDILKIKNGKDYKHLKKGEYPVYGTGGVMTYVDDFVYDKPSVLIPRKGSLDKIYYVEEPFWNVDTIFYTEIKENEVIPKYVYYYLQNEHLEKLNIAGGIPSLTQATLNKVKITIPSKDIQKRVVEVLDNFDKICNSLMDGLPAEIEARQKQYEYYRDKLLTFKELKVNE